MLYLPSRICESVIESEESNICTNFHLFSLGGAREHDGLIELGLGVVLDLAVRVELPQVDVVDEGDVVAGVPVQAVAVHVEGHRVDQIVDRGDDLRNEYQTRNSF